MTQGEEIPPEVEPRAYSNMPVWKRVVTILAGPAVNILLAVVIFAAIFWIGIPTFARRRPGLGEQRLGGRGRRPEAGRPTCWRSTG